MEENLSQLQPVQPFDSTQGKPKKNLKKLILILIIAGILIVGYFVAAKNQGLWPFGAQEQGSPSTSLGTTGDTASWKTYRNQEFGFEVRYPGDFSVVLEKNNFLKIDGPEKCNSADSGYCFDDIIEIKFLYNQGGLTAEEWFNEASQQGITFNKIGTKVISRQNVIVALPKDTEGFGTRYVFTGGGLLPNNTGQYIFDFLIYSGVDNELRDQILSTFRFIE